MNAVTVMVYSVCTAHTVFCTAGANNCVVMLCGVWQNKVCVYVVAV